MRVSVHVGRGGGGGSNQNTSMEGMGIFWNNTIIKGLKGAPNRPGCPGGFLGSLVTQPTGLAKLQINVAFLS